MAHAGWDILTIDMQHGLIDYGTALAMLQAMHGTGVVPFARVPWSEPGIVMKMLDAGVVGIIAPTINTRADAEQFVAACLYPPAGYRSIGPTRAGLYRENYVGIANDLIVTVALIETAEALENIEEIVSTPGLDAVLIGPSDLSRSLIGASQPEFGHPTVAAAVDRIISAARAAGRVAGVYTLSERDALAMARKGAQYLPVASDSRLLLLAARAMTAALRAEL